MNITDLFDKLDHWIWSTDGATLPPPARVLRNTLRVTYAVFRDIAAGRLNLHAMGLVYTTLLSIVPFLALSFSVLKGFGVHNQLRPVLESVLTDPLGDRATPVIDNVLLFVDNIEVGVLGTVGLGILVYTVIALVQKVERSFNEIWQVTDIRPLSQRFSNYLSVIMVGPLLVVAALGATAAVVSSAMVEEAARFEAIGWLFDVIGRAVPYLMIIGLFTFLYVLIPNTNVRIKYALIGAIVAGIIWQSLGFGFTLFLASSGKYTAIYSGFAIGIFMLIWLYLVWLLLLVGASVSFYSQHVQQITRIQSETSATTDEHTGLALVYRVARSFEDGNPLAISDVESTLSVGPDTVRRITTKLIANSVLAVAGAGGDRLVPGRPFDKLPIAKLMEIVRQPEHLMPASLTREQPVVDLAQRIASGVNTAFGDLTVTEWVRGQKDVDA